jgi:DNA recombination protein RmuC
MDTLLIILSVLAGIGAGIFIGIHIRKLIAEKNAVSVNKHSQLQQEFDNCSADLRHAHSEIERLGKEMQTANEEKKEFQKHIITFSEDAATLRSKTEHAELQAQNSEKKLLLFTEKLEEQQKKYSELQKETSELSAASRSLHERNTELVQETEQLKNQMSEKNNELVGVYKTLTSFKEQNKHLQEKLETQKQELEEIGQKFSKEFQLLADEILEQKSKKFADQNQANLKTILEPLGKNIEEFKRKVEETYDKESKERFSLAEKVKELADLNQIINQEAKNLTQALKGSVKQQGNWGEMLLESILQNSGLRKGFEYQVQEFIRDNAGDTIKDEEGRKLQPDIIVHLPDDRQIIIDSKVSLIAYDKYVASDEKHSQNLALAEHVKSIKAHIDNLSSKNYQSHVKSLDFVMLFVPIEPAYIIAMQHDTTLWEYAYKKRILLISPTNLIAALKLVADLWQREQQNKNAMKIAERGAQLYEKFVSFVESLEDVGKKIDGAQKSYDQAMNQLSKGRGNLVRQVEMLNELGVKAQKSIPSRMLDDDSDDTDDTRESLPEQTTE